MLSARRVIRGERFDLHFHPAAQVLDGVDVAGGMARLGLIVPKRLAKAASLRNAIKRQAREAFRMSGANLPAVDVVLRLTRPVKGIRARDLDQHRLWRAEIESLLARLAERAGEKPPAP